MIVAASPHADFYRMSHAPTSIRIANAAGFLGDAIDAPLRTVQATRLDYLTLEYLAELTMSILARLREKDPRAGYAQDFLRVLDSLMGELAAQPQLHIVTNAGGVNPPACAIAAGSLLCKAGLAETPLAVVDGDDMLPNLDAILAETPLAHFDTGEPLGKLRDRLVSANAYLGAEPIAAALRQQARVVITGRVADASLTLGPALAAFGWAANDYHRLAAASLAGHLIECGAQATGGFYTHWGELDLANIGFPVAELTADGDIHIFKGEGTTGRVSRETICEQLVYEIGDPACYRTPDVDLDLRQVRVEPSATNNDDVGVQGVVGQAPSEFYKASLAYRDGYLASAQMLVYGRDCLAKAEACAEVVRKRLSAQGHHFTRFYVEKLGAGEGVPGLISPPSDLREVMLRITVQHESRQAVEAFAQALAPLATGGPAGLAGYAALRPVVRPVFAYWPTLVPKRLLQPRVKVKLARDWA